MGHPQLCNSGKSQRCGAGVSDPQVQEQSPRRCISSWVRGSHPSKGAKDGAPTVVVIQAKVKGVGQECPTHMGRLHPLTREVEVDVLTRADGDSVYGGGAETPVLQRGNYFLVDVLLE